jgi:hypothetical protein
VFGAYWMAYGLFAPDERAWVAGAKVLAGSTGEEPLDKHIHALARTAERASDPSTRAAVFAQLMAACAPCHQQLPR